TGSRAAPTRMRDQKGFTLPAAEATLPSGELLQRVSEICVAEVRPECLREHELCVGGLPEQEVREALLPRRADEEVRIGELRRRESGGDRVIVDVLGLDAVGDEPSRSLGELGAAAVVERDPEVEPVAV